MDEFEEIEISACVYSDKGSGAIGFGVSSISGEEKSPEDFGTDWLYEGIGDSFWENYEDEFRSDVDAVRSAMDENEELSWDEAILQVLGHFHISYEVNGVETDLNYDFDYEEIMKDLLGEMY